MDLLTFLSSVINSLAWPSLLAAVLYYGRNDIFKLVRTIKSIKYDKFEMMFEEKAAQAAEDAEDISDGFEDRSEKYKDFVFLSPYETVMKSYIKLEDALQATISRKIEQGVLELNDLPYRNGKRPSIIPTESATRLLLEKGLVDNEFVSIHTNLRKLRNLAAHKHNLMISNEAAKNFADSTIILIDKLNAI